MNGTKPVVKGVGVYIFNNDKTRMLLAQRGSGARHQQYKWEGPGGQLEPGESYEQAAHREIMEELGITVQLGDILGEFESITDSNGEVWEAKIFAATTSDTPRLVEPDKCCGIGWFSREEVAQLPLADYVVKDMELIGWL